MGMRGIEMQRINPAYTQSASIMRFKTAYPSWALILIASILVVPKVVALPEKVPSDVLELRPGGYVYADYPGVFDDAEGDGITVEAWIYLTERPQDGDYHDPERRWIIFAKPFSYFVTITGRDLGPGPERLAPEGTTYIYFGVQRLLGGGDLSSGISGRVIPPHDFPLKRWVHIAYQIAVKGNSTQENSYYDGGGSGGIFGHAMGRTDAQLLIGGTKRNGWGWGYGSMKGYIDEVRVSKGFRYGKEPGKKIRPEKRFREDGRTIALWHFDEGPGSRIYRDSSGNDYHLFPGGSLATAVRSRGKLATTWGSLKR